MVVEAWEIPLIKLASQALYSHRPAANHLHDTHSSLEQAYLLCKQITQEHSKSFYMASRFIAPENRPAIWALYAFCRTVDDLVDYPSVEAEVQLAQWVHYTLHGHPPHGHLLATAWCKTLAHYHIPKEYAVCLIEGVLRDLKQQRYETFDELTTYCYGVASTVGLMAMHIVGFQSQAAVPYAIKLGVALQLTNILRDVAEDWERGRVYLPQSELAAFGLSEKDLERGCVDDRWRAFMKFQIERTRRLYAASLPGIALLSPGGRFAIAAAARFYQAILDDIEQHDYDVFTRRAHVNKWSKIRQIPFIWLQTTQFHTFFQH